MGLLGLRGPWFQDMAGVPHPRPGKGLKTGLGWCDARALGLLPDSSWGEGCHTPAAGLQQAVADLQGRHAKVRNTDVVLLIQQQVLRLQVPVAGEGGGAD